MDDKQEARMGMARRVQQIMAWETRLSQGWVAAQTIGGVTFILERSSMHFTDDELDNLKFEALLNMAFNKILGFSRASDEHAQYWIDLLNEDLAVLDAQIEELETLRENKFGLIELYKKGYPKKSIGDDAE